MNKTKLERITTMEQELAALKQEVELEEQTARIVPGVVVRYKQVPLCLRLVVCQNQKYLLVDFKSGQIKGIHPDLPHLRKFYSYEAASIKEYYNG